MRKIMFGAALAAAMAAPALANADTSGSINLGFETTEYDSGGEFDAYNLGATIVHGLSGNMTIQADGRTTLQDWGSSEDSHGYAAAHLSWDLGGWDAGVIGGLANYYGDGGTVFGGEARTAFGNFSVDGSIILTDFLDNDYSGWTTRVGGAYFFSPNMAVNANIATTDIDASFGDYEIDEMSIGGAYQFANGVALNINYTNSDYDNNGGSNESDAFRIGARFNFGGGSLQENTNNGAWASTEHNANTWMRW